MTPDRQLIHQATLTLTSDELAVWLTKHIAGKGRRTGSLILGITEDQWRYRIRSADLKLATINARRNAA